MTVLAAEPDLRGLSDDDLAAMSATATEDQMAAIVAELGRRDRLEKARQQRDGQRDEWESGAYAQMLQAERECCGNLVNRRGVALGITDWSLWSGTEARAMAYATEELRNFWDAHPRVTVSDYRQQISDGHRIQRDDRDRELVQGGQVITDGIAAAAERGGEYAARYAQAQQRVKERAAELRGEIQGGREVAVREQGTVASRRPEVDGEQVLGYASALLSRYARFPSQYARDAAVLWAAHAHARDAEGMLIWDATPRLMFLSSEPGSGKSRALELTGMLSPETHGLDTEPSEAGLVYTIASEHATVLLDEGDVLFGSGKRKAGIRAVLNAGYTRGGTVLRMRGGKGQRAKVFGAVALAGLDVMKTATGESLAPLFSRAIVVRMRKSADPVPRLDREARQAGMMLRTALAAWTAGVRDDLASAEPEIPEGVGNRAEEIWTPLLAIGEAAGGDWPERARRACEELALYADAPGSDETGTMMSDLAAMVGGWATEED